MRGVDTTGSLGWPGVRLCPAAGRGEARHVPGSGLPGRRARDIHVPVRQASQTWPHSINGVAHVDAISGDQYAARAIIVQLAQWAPIQGDDKERVDVEVIGSGDGFLALDGRVYPITWSKDSAAGPTRFAYADGSAVELPRGQVWIEVASEDAGVTAR